MNAVNAANAVTRIELDWASLEPAQTAVQLILIGQQPHALTPMPGRVRVAAGRAWLSAGGQDVILLKGESFSLTTKHTNALISAVDKVPALIQLID